MSADRARIDVMYYNALHPRTAEKILPINITSIPPADLGIILERYPNVDFVTIPDRYMNVDLNTLYLLDDFVGMFGEPIRDHLNRSGNRLDITNSAIPLINATNALFRDDIVFTRRPQCEKDEEGNGKAEVEKASEAPPQKRQKRTA